MMTSTRDRVHPCNHALDQLQRERDRLLKDKGTLIKANVELQRRVEELELELAAREPADA